MSFCDNKQKLLDFSQGVMNIRFWEEKNLPLSQSRIAFDLLVFIANCHYSDTQLTLKRLFNSLNYSERGVRYVLEQFVDGGWCEVVGHSTDKRFRLVVASEQLTSAFQAYEQTFFKSFEPAFCNSLAINDASVDEAVMIDFTGQHTD